MQSPDGEEQFYPAWVFTITCTKSHAHICAHTLISWHSDKETHSKQTLQFHLEWMIWDPRTENIENDDDRKWQKMDKQTNEKKGKRLKANPMIRHRKQFQTPVVTTRGCAVVWVGRGLFAESFLAQVVWTGVTFVSEKLIHCHPVTPSVGHDIGRTRRCRSGDSLWHLNTCWQRELAEEQTEAQCSRGSQCVCVCMCVIDGKAPLWLRSAFRDTTTVLLHAGNTEKHKVMFTQRDSRNITLVISVCGPDGAALVLSGNPCWTSRSKDELIRSDRAVRH